MRRHNTFAQIVAIAPILLAIGTRHAACDENTQLEQCRIEWNDFLEKQCKDETAEQVVRKAMAGKYRDVGLARSEGGNHRLLFLLDDYHQIAFVFDHDNKLIFTPTVVPKERWLRSPDGWLISIPTQAEREMEAKAAKLAIRYVAQRTARDHDSLEASCWRGAKASTWVVLVDIKKNLAAIDTLGYHLEVTDDGRVKETVPFKHDREP